LATKVPPMSAFGDEGVKDTLAGDVAFTGISGIAKRNVANSIVALVSILFSICNASEQNFVVRNIRVAQSVGPGIPVAIAGKPFQPAELWIASVEPIIPLAFLSFALAGTV